MSKQPPSGFLIVDKPQSYTSHDVVAVIRKAFRRTFPDTRVKVGHTGTLDPFATGVLLITVGQATRLTEYTHSLSKTYRATITLGAISTTGDPEGAITSTNPRRLPDKQEIQDILPTFVGAIKQTPPAYAAIKVKGRKLYEYARTGDAVAIPTRTVFIHDLTVIGYNAPHLLIQVTCGSGTYIRSLGRDIGEKLKVGGYVTTLRRTAIGRFIEQKAICIDQIQQGQAMSHLRHPAELVDHLPSIVLEKANVAKFLNGGAVVLKEPLNLHTNQALSIAVLSQNKLLLGIGVYVPATNVLSPQKVLTI